MIENVIQVSILSCIITERYVLCSDHNEGVFSRAASGGGARAQRGGARGGGGSVYAHNAAPAHVRPRLCVVTSGSRPRRVHTTTFSFCSASKVKTFCVLYGFV